ncbi:MAG: hypothetical protein LBT18_02785 [Endomicrobium sp.]|jgi:hypothetical protein|nr:hypothetical protein [Endomicrobium sp.]
MIKNSTFDVASLEGALNISETGTDAISVYIAKLKSQAGDTTEIIRAFVQGIVERALVASIQHDTGFDKTDSSILESFISEVKTIAEIQVKLNGALPDLIARAFERNDPQAINAIIELISAIAEERRTFALTDNINQQWILRTMPVFYQLRSLT